MGAFQWGGTITLRAKPALRIFEQTAEQTQEHGGLYWIAPDGTTTSIRSVGYTAEEGPLFDLGEETKLISMDNRLRRDDE